MNGTVFNIQRFSLYDGPGVRTVVFLKGCPLRCLWCHNPEGLSPKPQWMYNPERCIGCGECAAVCPNHCHKMENAAHLFDPAGCTQCGACSENCCALALTQTGQSLSAQQILDTVLLDEKHYAATGGGLTLSGGEPLLQAEFSAALLQMAKAQGIHTCVETSGFGKMEEIAKYTDLFLFDYKATGEEAHRRLCGVSQQPILENLALLDRLGKPVVLRCPIIPELNGNDAHLAGIAATADRFPCIQRIELEPYHRLGVSKAAQLGLETTYEGQPPDPQWLTRFAKALQKQCPIPVQINQ